MQLFFQFVSLINETVSKEFNFCSSKDPVKDSNRVFSFLGIYRNVEIRAENGSSKIVVFVLNGNMEVYPTTFLHDSRKSVDFMFF